MRPMRLLRLTSLVLLAACNTLPERPPDTQDSFRVSQPSAAEIEARIGPRDPTHSGVMLLGDGRDALLARLALADAARETIDVQYYIWAGDAVGVSIVDRLLDAAERGVRVRLLVDDLVIVGVDQQVAALDAHPNIEIRSFNPFRFRKRFGPIRRFLDLVTGAARLNHRMHNKVFAVDNFAAVVGGRNLTDGYFGANATYSYRDIDLLTVGPVVDDISASFDDYWNSEWSIPLRALTNVKINAGAAREIVDQTESKLFRAIEAFDTSDYVRRIVDDLIWCRAEVVVDPPVKAEGLADFVSPVAERLVAVSRNANDVVLIENAFFIPGKAGVSALSGLAQRGVSVRILTNSLASNDAGASHAGYKKYRKGLIEGNVELYELRPDADLRSTFTLASTEVSSAALHSKAAAIDGKVGFVGSFNLDPRSLRINTEIGVLVHDEEFTAELARYIEDGMQPSNSWRLALDSRGSLNWVGAETLTKEPKAAFKKRFAAWLLALLPVEGQL